MACTFWPPSRRVEAAADANLSEALGVVSGLADEAHRPVAEGLRFAIGLEREQRHVAVALVLLDPLKRRLDRRRADLPAPARSSRR